MTLSTELPNDFKRPPFSSAANAVKCKQAERDAIAEQTRQFLRKRKNKIEEVPIKPAKNSISWGEHKVLSSAKPLTQEN